MGAKHRTTTIAWCFITMVATSLLSHGHLIIKEIMLAWPVADTWEARLESALYTQGGLVFLASCTFGAAMVIRGYVSRIHEERQDRRRHLQREQHERAAAERHEALMDSLSSLGGGSSPKKSPTSGVKPR